MKSEIFIVSFRKHFPFLQYSLRSIEKFCSGYQAVRILVPDEDLLNLRYLVSKLPGTSGIPFICMNGPEWPGKGFLWHLYQIMIANENCPTADEITHWDSDTIFTDYVTPETFRLNGKPILRYESFSTLGARHPGTLNWKKACEDCLPFECANEGMRGFPHRYLKTLYPAAKTMIEQATGKPLEEYIKSCRNEYPQTFAEHPTLAAVAMKCFPNEYAFVDCALQDNPDYQPFPVFQAWANNLPTVPTALWFKGKVETIVPMDIYKGLGLI